MKALFQRWPKLALAVDESEIKWRRRPGLRAIDHLPVANPAPALASIDAHALPHKPSDVIAAATAPIANRQVGSS
jgi:hypothetical protein